jgi:hypothetical protein
MPVGGPVLESTAVADVGSVTAAGAVFAGPPEVSSTPQSAGPVALDVLPDGTSPPLSEVVAVDPHAGAVAPEVVSVAPEVTVSPEVVPVVGDVAVSPGPDATWPVGLAVVVVEPEVVVVEPEVVVVDPEVVPGLPEVTVAVEPVGLDVVVVVGVVPVVGAGRVAVVPASASTAVKARTASASASARNIVPSRAVRGSGPEARQACPSAPVARSTLTISGRIDYGAKATLLQLRRDLTAVALLI